MNGRDFLDVARRLAAGPSEADWRSAAGRAYYASLHEAAEALQRWGFPSPRRDQIHSFVRLRFLYAADPDCKRVGASLEKLLSLRNQADYQLGSPGRFSTSLATLDAVRQSTGLIVLLDAIEGDAGRKTVAIAAVRATLPP